VGPLVIGANFRGHQDLYRTIHIPGLPASAYFDPRLFPWVPFYEKCFAEIRRELQALLTSARGRERVFATEALEEQYIGGDTVRPTWEGYYFYRHGVRRQDNCLACPMTAAALDAISLIRIREHAPETLFSILSPGTHLRPHYGVTNARVVSHLPIIIPENCALRVGGETRSWREGEIILFDDTYEHEAWNESTKTRVVLIADVWNPHLTEVERSAVTSVIAAIGDLHGSADRL
jgi:aspartate beta-hydroxylase